MKDYSFRGVECTKEEADTFCWGARKAKGGLERLCFKLPPLQENQVRVKVLHVGLCHTDCLKVDELWMPNATYPLVPGHEIIGEIEKVGSRVRGHKSGDIVAISSHIDCCGACESCLQGNDQLCMSDLYRDTYDPLLGGYSTHMHIRGDFVYPLPKGIPPSKAAPIMCAGITLFAPLKRWAKPGTRCGIIGIGGLGHLGVQMAAKMGMHVVAISTRQDKEAEARVFGAREFVCSKDSAQMKRLQTTEQLDLIINTAVVHDITDYLYCVKPGSVFVQCGLPETAKPVVFNNLDLVCNQKVLTGSLVGNRLELAQCLDFCDKFATHPVTENYAWADFPKAYQKIHDGVPRYRCVVDVASTFDHP